MLSIGLLPSPESCLEARSGRMIQADKGADPPGADAERSAASRPENGMWLLDSFAKLGRSDNITLNM